MNKKEAIKKMSENLGVSIADAELMYFKTELYEKAAILIKESKKSHMEIAEDVGTSRSRITRISNMGEISVSIEILTKVIMCLEKKFPLKLAA